MSDDFETNSVKSRLQRLDYQRQLALTDLAEARATNDFGSGAEAAQAIADIDASKANLIGLYNRHVAESTPQRPVELTAEQKRVQPLKTWQDAASVCGVSQEDYVKGYQQMKDAGKIGEFRRSEDES